MSEKKIEENVKLVEKLIDLLVKSDRKTNIINMLESEVGTNYFMAPASSKSFYHYSWPGGLVSHSINVFKNLKKLNDTFEYNFDSESMLICSLFHDLGKACASNLQDPHYIVNTEEWKINKGYNYDYNYKGVYFPNHQRSLYILQHFEIPLSAEEYQAILLNDGQYILENSGYKLKECTLALVLHVADRLSLEFEKNDNPQIS